MVTASTYKVLSKENVDLYPKATENFTAWLLAAVSLTFARLVIAFSYDEAEKLPKKTPAGTPLEEPLLADDAAQQQHGDVEMVLQQQSAHGDPRPLAAQRRTPERTAAKLKRRQDRRQSRVDPAEDADADADASSRPPDQDTDSGLEEHVIDLPSVEKPRG
eukprot:TRINITY_DN26768_c0_g1_i1.p1 TRINITY_DN26768_c0_g1~~TRINITY_DN26768_c0_g1_i1.p1  ORF type:complete len:183 (-),score=40.83 TRINITY_DN26768_c0_g1_i1:143-625(-)